MNFKRLQLTLIFFIAPLNTQLSQGMTSASSASIPSVVEVNDDVLTQAKEKLKLAIAKTTTETSTDNPLYEKLIIYASRQQHCHPKTFCDNEEISLETLNHYVKSLNNPTVNQAYNDYTSLTAWHFEGNNAAMQRARTKLDYQLIDLGTYYRGQRQDLPPELITLKNYATAAETELNRCAISFGDRVQIPLAEYLRLRRSMAEIQEIVQRVLQPE